MWGTLPNTVGNRREQMNNSDCLALTCPEGAKRGRKSDSGGLYLEASPAGSKRWFYKFRDGKKESRLALGRFPDVSLKAARDARDEARKIRATGANPVQKRRANKLAEAASGAATFELVARDFHATKASGWSVNHAKHWLEGVAKHLFPRLGTLPIAEISAPFLLDVLRRVESTNRAKDMREFAGQVFNHGIATGRCGRNLAHDLRGTLQTHTVKHMSAILDPRKVGELMRAIAGYSGQPTTRAALQLAALTFQRPGEIRQMEWAELDLDAAMWTIAAVKMKGRLERKRNGPPHLVSLSRQAVAVLRDLHPETGHGKFVFPSMLSGERPMSDATLITALRRLGYAKSEMTAHGFRALARTLIAEKLGVHKDVIEAQLAHAKSGSLGAAYDRAQFVGERVQMMQAWADYIDQLRDGAQVVQLRAS